MKTAEQYELAAPITKFSALSIGNLAKWIATFLVPLLVWLIPMPFDNNIKMFLVITAWGITSWMVTVIPVAVTGALLPSLYLFFGVAGAEVVFGAWTNTVIWMTVAVILIGLAADRSKISLRLAYKILLKLDCSLRGLIWSFSIAGIFLAFVITDNMARCIVFLTIAVGVCQALGIKAKSKEATALCLAGFFAMSGPSIGTLTAGNGLYFNSVFREVAGYDITYFQWMLHNFIPALAWTFFGIISIIKVLKIGNEKTYDAKSELQKCYAELGPVQRKEIFVFVYLLMVVGTVILSGIYGFDPMLVVALFLFLMFIPGIDILSVDDFDKADFKILFVMTGAISIGSVASSVGLIDVLVEYVTPLLAGSPVRMVFGTYIFSALANFILTPLAIIFTFTELFTEMAMATGVNPLPVIYALNLGSDVYVFPYEFAVLLIAYSFGYMNYSDTVKVLLARTILSVLVMAVFMIPLWFLMGLL